MIKNFLAIFKDRKFWYYFAIVLIFFGIFFELDFATDTYADVMSDPGSIITNFLQGGRFITVLCFMVFKFLHLGLRLANLASFLLAIISLTFALYLLEQLIRDKLIKNSTWAFLLPILLVLNPFIIELFMYVEKGIMLFGVLCCVLAVREYVKFLDQSARRPLILSIVFSILAATSYQGVVGLLIVLATIFTLTQSANFKTFVKNTCISVGIYAAGPVVDLILIKLLATGGRTGGGIILTESLQKLFQSFGSMFQTFHILPEQTFAIVITCILLFWVIALWRRHQLWSKNTLLTLAEMIYLSLVVILAALAPQLAQATNVIWVVARSTYVFASLPAVILTIILARHYKTIFAEHVINFALLAVSFVLLTLQFYRFNSISIDHYNGIALDRHRAEELNALITDYETQHQTTITQIMPAIDSVPTYAYPGVFASGDINVSSFVTAWSDVNGINFWTGRDFARQPADEAWQKYCADHNWSYFDESQIKFDGSTLKICFY